MSPRTTSKTVTFALPFLLKGVDRVLPAGDYRVVTDEELMGGLSFPVYRRVSTMILVPTESRQIVEMLTVDPLDLQVAQDRDVARTKLRRPTRSNVESSLREISYLIA